MKLAIFTPWPHQRSGIADYSYDSVLGLAKIGEQVTVFTDLDTGVATAAIDVPVRSYRTFSQEAGQYDCVVFHIGNNPDYHAWMLPLIRTHGGVIHLHDLVLQHLLAWVTQGRGEEYLAMIERWYGNTVRGLVREMLTLGTPPWETSVVTDIPLFEEVVQYADACVVHSEFARERIAATFPLMNVARVPHVYCRLPKPTDTGRTRSALRIGVFGEVQPNRHVDLILRAVAQASKSSATAIELMVAGKLAASCAGLPKLAEDLCHERFTASFLGYVDFERLHALLSSCDVMISLRYPTMGESSGVVMRSLQYGIPTIVTQIGWYAELPEVVHKVDPQAMLQSLTDLLSRLLDTPGSLREWQSTCRKYAHTSLDFDRTIGEYNKFLVHASGHRLVERQLAKGMVQSFLGNADAVVLESIVSRVNSLLAR